MLTISKPNLLVDLRERTQVEHRRVEKHPLLRQLMAATLSLEHYSKVIAMFTGFYETLESKINEISSRINFPGYQYQPRLPLLLEDRKILPIHALTPCTTTPGISRDDELLGVLYVLEGATQGGRVISPWLQQRLALTGSNGARYFNFYRQHSWQKFRPMVEHCQQHYDHQLVVTAAGATFDCLHSHLDLYLLDSGDEYSE